MLDLAKIKLIAQSYSPQELFAALVWQRRFNEFDGEEVITDLAKNSSLWASFMFTKPIFAPDENGLSFGGVIDTLLAMANYRPMPETSILRFVAYPADTLYILAENQDTIVSQLLDLGKKWRADSVDITDGTNEDYTWRLKRRLMARLEAGVSDQEMQRDRDAVVMSYWWD
ncbi:hypothetical protein MC7420_5213 [Coleofasciculus chthonoplastes PCC 7420]|uniref:Uncharacterized protein n=1 Tax=Coleofasciculus chthonoplastes PCC 7420 TaxID=118168 RepID=B4W2E4_9CYAN|nr:hypothetical protein [Coleofasciculus chthonoplastes]EDX71588.1 hypothetical protein MC7420_5213 [Coleofasciculus chthonoplastes PCC 7420]